MEEQESNVMDVTVKTLDSQSRTYTVRAQVSRLPADVLLPKASSLKLLMVLCNVRQECMEHSDREQ